MIEFLLGVGVGAGLWCLLDLYLENRDSGKHKHTWTPDGIGSYQWRAGGVMYFHCKTCGVEGKRESAMLEDIHEVTSEWVVDFGVASIKNDLVKEI